VTIVAATGLQREARLIAGPGIEVVVGGGDSVRLEAALDRLAGEARGFISIGLAGALAPGLRSGQWIVPDAVLADGERYPTDSLWTDRLQACLGGATRGLLLGRNEMAAEAREKAALYRATGAQTVDMESHIVARVAHRHRLSMVAARVVSDASHQTLPPAARVGMRPDGGMDLAAVLRSLMRNPFQLAALIRTGLEAEKGFRALLRGCRDLGSGLGGL